MTRSTEARTPVNAGLLPVCDLPRGYSWAAYSSRGGFAVLMPPMKPEIQVNYGNAPPLMQADVPCLTMIRAANNGQIFLYACEKQAETVRLSPFYFANVYEHAGVCWGRYQTTPEGGLRGAWDKYWNSPFNMDLAGNSFHAESARIYNEWERDEWPKILAAAPVRRRPRHRASAPHPLMAALHVIDRHRSDAMRRYERVTKAMYDCRPRYQVDTKTGAMSAVSPTPKRYEKLEALKKFIEKRDGRSAERRVKLANQLSIEVDKVSGAVNAHPREYTNPTVRRNVTLRREWVISWMKADKRNLAYVKSMIQERNLSRFADREEELRSKHSAKIGKRAEIEAVKHHFEGQWAKALSWRWNMEDVIGKRLHVIPKGMDCFVVVPLSCDRVVPESDRKWKVEDFYVGGRPRSGYVSFGRYIDEQTVATRVGDTEVFLRDGVVVSKEEFVIEGDEAFEKRKPPPPVVPDGAAGALQCGDIIVLRSTVGRSPAYSRLGPGLIGVVVSLNRHMIAGMVDDSDGEFIRFIWTWTGIEAYHNGEEDVLIRTSQFERAGAVERIGHIDTHNINQLYLDRGWSTAPLSEDNDEEPEEPEEDAE